MKLSGLIARLSSTGAAGVPGTTETNSGILDGTVSGRAVGRAAFYQTSTWGPGLTIAGTGRVFNPLGSIKFNATATWTVNANATESYTGKLKVRGGTGLYRTAHGTATVAELLERVPDAFTARSQGTSLTRCWPGQRVDAAVRRVRF